MGGDFESALGEPAEVELLGFGFDLLKCNDVDIAGIDHLEEAGHPCAKGIDVPGGNSHASILWVREGSRGYA